MARSEGLGQLKNKKCFTVDRWRRFQLSEHLQTLEITGLSL
jgi:hypothetical protein